MEEKVTSHFTRSGNPTIGVALTLYASAKPDAEATCRSAIKMLYPNTSTLTPDACRAFFNQVPLRDLDDKLAESRTRWTPTIEAELIARGHTSTSQLKNYPARIATFLDFARAVGLVERTRVELSEAWQTYLDNAFTLLPAGRDELRGMVAIGVKKILDKYTITVDDIDKFSAKISNIRWASKRMAEAATIEGLTPRDFADLIILGPRQDEIGNYTGQKIYATYCRNLWNATTIAYPELGLTLWPSRQVKVSLPDNKWPLPLRNGFDEALFSPERCRGLKPATIKTRRQAIGSYLGILDGIGVNLNVVADLGAKDAVRLLTQGIPRECLSGDPIADAPRSLVARMLRDSDFRSQVLKAMWDLEGSRDGKESAPNPYVELYTEARLAARQVAAADNLIDVVGVINREYLCIRDPHDKWIQATLKTLDRARKEASTDYDAKKKVLFRTPRLWADLVSAVRQMATELQESPRRGTPRWATQCRDVAYLWLMLTYPLRVGNTLRMQLGRNFDPSTMWIHFDGDDVKNEKPIDFEVPTQGEYGEPLHAFIKLYLDEARPILLVDADSLYFFLPDQRTPNAGPHLRRTAFNEILIALSENKLQNVLPPDLGPLNPHLFRHIVATYQIAVNGSPIKAAQLLNDRLETVLAYYADILPAARHELKDFYNTLTP